VLGDPADPQTIVSTSPEAQAADGAQYMSGCGPIFDAYTGDLPVFADRAPDDPRWPELGRADHGSPAGAWLALPLTLEEKPAGVFMIYGETGSAFDERTAEEATPFVTAAGTLVRDSHTMQEIRQVQDQLREALHSRAIIDQAKGMIMQTRRCSADEAFAVLAKMSNDGNRKIRDLAAEFVEEAVQPGPPMR
jgi:transcriptional regulator with GAF, ATPase, and Fis domain